MKGFEKAGYSIRKVTVVGNSKGITLPEDWIEARWYKLIKVGNRIILEPIK
jgi:virulence-associated protein VagC